MLIHLICAARPNFMKIAPLYHELKKRDWADVRIIHTGQHYDINMSDVFFKDLALPPPDIHLGIGSGSHGFQTGQVLMAYEKVVIEQRPDMVVVVGDVNSTLACSLSTVKVNLENGSRDLGFLRPKIVHLEAGLRSFDLTMPEEINRILTDRISDLLLTPSVDADENLIREGIAPEKIVRVGNIMIDSLEMLRDKIESQTTWKELWLKKGEFALVTLHRPSNVDDKASLNKIFACLKKVSQKLDVLIPLHPRTRKNLQKTDIFESIKNSKNIRLLEPLPYVKFMNLLFNSAFVITDSGGIQEETTYLGIPCLTLRPNTERPVTITQGTNRLCSVENLLHEVQKILGKGCQRPSIELWDGRTSDRIADLFEQRFLAV